MTMSYALYLNTFILIESVRGRPPLGDGRTPPRPAQPPTSLPTHHPHSFPPMDIIRFHQAHRSSAAVKLSRQKEFEGVKHRHEIID